MPEPLAKVAGELLERIGEASSVFCFLDCDGTLAPLMPTPDEAVPLPGTADLLRDLAALPFGHEVAEVRPSHVNKGSSAAALLAARAPAALPIYIGDDLTDEDAFAGLPLHAITIFVGPAAQPTAARYRTETPQDVQRFLRALLERRRHTV